MHVGVDEARDKIPPRSVDPIGPVEPAQACYIPIRNRDIGAEPFLGEGAEDLRTFDYQVRLGVASGNGDKSRAPIQLRPAMSSGVNGTRTRG